MVVDEFGRDVKSQHVLARERRFQRRSEIRKQQHHGPQVPALTSPIEQQEMNERRDALRQALRIALDDMDEEFASLSNLAALFQEWHRKQPQDYASCHAGMSLADLASVLIHVDVFSTHYPLNWTASGSFPHMDVLQQMAFNEGLEETPLYRTVDKILIPVFEDVLEQYDMNSLHQTKSMATYFRDMSKLLPEGNILLDKLTSQVVDWLRRGLQDMVIPIINKESSASDENDVVLIEAITYATKTQVSRIQTILSNIFIYWVPLLGDRLADPMLDFLSSQFLYLVSSLESPTKVFRAVWPTLKETQWLNRPELMVAAAPLRAAAAAFEAE
jgi:NTP pyrophosphatase (non-canonical NTP hydrolase)